MMGSKVWSLGGVLLALPLLIVGCDDDDAAAGDGGAGDDAAIAAGCTVMLEPAEGDSYESVQEALLDAETGDTICFADGTYSFTRELSLTRSGITMRGNAADREAVTFDFADQDVLPLVPQSGNAPQIDEGHGVKG